MGALLLEQIYGVSKYLFVLFVLCIVGFSFASFLLEAKKLSKGSSLLVLAINITSALCILLGFLLLYLDKRNDNLLALAVVFASYILISPYIIARFIVIDKLIFSLVNFLSYFGVMLITRMHINQGLVQALNLVVSIVAMLFCVLLLRLKPSKLRKILLACSAVGLLLLPLVFGKEINGAKAWISIFGVNFQPSEIVKVLSVVLLASLLNEKKYYHIVMYVAFCLVALTYQKDLGTALIYFCLGFWLFYIARRSVWVLAAGLAVASLSSYVGYMMFSHVKKRVRIWIDPWADSSGEGYQIVQSLLAIENGSWFGLGFLKGNASRIPEHDTDFIFSFIANEFGVVFSACLIFIFLVIFLRTIFISRHVNGTYFSYLTIGAGIILFSQVFVIIGGNIKLIPLTGITLPFISYGGSSLLSSFALTGVIHFSYSDYIARCGSHNAASCLE